ncbi:MAG: hypothetical protein DI573_07310 [Microbacterium sp.]|uniref:hypothetical protein n=1 Tax=Microbacterium sp. TaxID=51671 RepID=UPI000DB83C78|nr:hypothetical protein [Microbacterium sp.]PZU39346.1 MAG: hypothetical protein DI573_07310 [Microbacterium sp.]
MEPLFTFLGSYWWLVFPLVGVMGGLGSAWERGARRRHKRRLEILRAKSELRAAAVAGSLPSTDLQVPGAADARADTPAARLQRLFDEHDAITARWLDYELDVAKIIAFPAMSDGRQPLTAAFLRAKRKADGLRPASVKARLSKEALAEYRDAVTEFATAFEIAERDARRIRDSSFTESERKRLDTAKQLLTVAIDQAATPAERQLAYRRVREELDGLILLSDGAIDALEERVALELTSGQGSPPGRGSAPEQRPAPGQGSTPASQGSGPGSGFTATARDAEPDPDGSSDAGSSGAPLPSVPRPVTPPPRTNPAPPAAPGRITRPRPPA